MTRRLFGLGLLILAVGCGTAPSKPAPAASEPLRIAAASDLQTALPALVARFKRDRKIEVEFTIGSSGQLAKQIQQGAPFDVFLSANRKFVVDLAGENVVVPDSVRPYARGSLVLAVHHDFASQIKSLQDLTRPEIKKIALANPKLAPYGLAGKQALERAKLWDAVADKVVQAETVRQALQFIQTGNAEAGLVGSAVADVAEVRSIAVDPSLYDPITQALGVVSASKNRDAADAFAQFVLSEPGQSILAGFGFTRVDAP
jgi:molybdate transport system substrate-binding protein